MSGERKLAIRVAAWSALACSIGPGNACGFEPFQPATAAAAPRSLRGNYLATPASKSVSERPNNCIHRTRRFRSVSMLDACSRRVGDARRWTCSMNRSLWHSCALVLLLGALAPGCASPPRTSPVVTDPVAAPLKSGERITVDFGGFDAVPVVCEIDAHGCIPLPDNISVEVSGLSPDQAAGKIHDTFVPKYYRRLQVHVARVQPGGPANRSQPAGSETNRTSSAAGPGG